MTAYYSPLSLPAFADFLWGLLPFSESSQAVIVDADGLYEGRTGRTVLKAGDPGCFGQEILHCMLFLGYELEETVSAC